MEFGIFLNGYIPGPAAHQTEMEHTMLFREAEYVIFADKHNWKYAWLGEHHALTEYSHMSAPEVVMGFNLPDYKLRTDIIPGQVSRLTLTADKAGTFPFLCDIFCGDGHEGMSGKLVVT